MNEVFEIAKTGVQFFFQHLVVFNMLFAIVIVFFQRRDPKSVWAWLLLSAAGAGHAQAENVPDQRGGGSHQ